MSHDHQEHHHEHDENNSHDHDHHHHDHHHQTESEMTFNEKAIKLIDHWIKHNNDHGDTYNQWIDKFKSNDIIEAAEKLTEVSELTNQINSKLNSALSAIQSKQESDEKG